MWGVCCETCDCWRSLHKHEYNVSKFVISLNSEQALRGVPTHKIKPSCKSSNFALNFFLFFFCFFRWAVSIPPLQLTTQWSVTSVPSRTGRLGSGRTFFHDVSNSPHSSNPKTEGLRSNDQGKMFRNDLRNFKHYTFYYGRSFAVLPNIEIYFSEGVIWGGLLW
jgi:hypothetical protein